MSRLLLAGLACALFLPGCGGGDSSETEPRFEGSVVPIDSRTRARMRFSWRPGCPVELEDLRLVAMLHWGFDGAVHRGELVVHEDEAEDVLGVFRTLFAERFPIARMHLVDAYGADDNRSMAANNSSAFNCRRVAGSRAWSEHAYGKAVDLNPVQNPYVSGKGEVSPPGAERYADRTRTALGMIHSADAVVRAFASIGWKWGGDWYSAKDYQHFSATGR